jgi:hypothetical protein
MNRMNRIRRRYQPVILPKSADLARLNWAGRRELRHRSFMTSTRSRAWQVTAVVILTAGSAAACSSHAAPGSASGIPHRHQQQCGSGGNCGSSEPGTRHSSSAPTPTPTRSPSPAPTRRRTPTPAPTHPRRTRRSPAPSPAPAGQWPVTSLHYTANDNFGPSGAYLPGADGFNLADVGDKGALDALPAGVLGLVWLGACGGATAAFRAQAGAFAGDRKLFGFYITDEPDPSSCPAGAIRAEDDWIHAHVPGAKTFAILQNLASDSSPDFTAYTPHGTGLDLIGLDPYPVTSAGPPDYREIAGYVAAAQAAGWPVSRIVPVYQVFGHSSEGDWMLPTTDQERVMLADWAAVTPAPAFDYAYSWGSQSGDTGLARSPALQAIFAAKN